MTTISEQCGTSLDKKIFFEKPKFLCWLICGNNSFNQQNQMALLTLKH